VHEQGPKGNRPSSSKAEDSPRTNKARTKINRFPPEKLGEAKVRPRKQTFRILLVSSAKVMQHLEFAFRMSVEVIGFKTWWRKRCD
jgi:hypothetical protein